MITKIYATFDKKANAFNERFFQAPNDEVAIRSVETNQLHDEFFNINAADFEVYCIGLYDAETGIITPEKRLIMQIKQKSEKDIKIALGKMSLEELDVAKGE